MNKNAVIGVSLWLQPAPESLLYDAIKSTIDGLKPLFDDAPSFPPHITITSNIMIPNQNGQSHIDSVLDRALAAAKSVPHVDVVFTDIKYGARFFKKVYFQAQSTPELLSLAMVSRENFVCLPELRRSKLAEKARGVPSTLTQEEEDEHTSREAAHEAAKWAKNEYDPHVSLVYSDAYPIEEALQQTVDTRLKDVFGENYAHKGIGWTGGRLSLVRCEGPVEDWQVLGYRDI